MEDFLIQTVCGYVRVRNGLVLLCVVLCRVALGAFSRLFDVSLSRLSLPFCVPSRFIAGFP